MDTAIILLTLLSGHMSLVSETVYHITLFRIWSQEVNKGFQIIYSENSGVTILTLKVCISFGLGSNFIALVCSWRNSYVLQSNLQV